MAILPKYKCRIDHSVVNHICFKSQIIECSAQKHRFFLKSTFVEIDEYFRFSISSKIESSLIERES